MLPSLISLTVSVNVKQRSTKCGGPGWYGHAVFSIRQLPSSEGVLNEEHFILCPPTGCCFPFTSSLDNSLDNIVRHIDKCE